MDTTSFVISAVFGLVGLFFLMYGKSAGQLVPMGVGAALCIIPYFIPNAIAMLVVCVLLTAVPLVVHDG